MPKKSATTKRFKLSPLERFESKKYLGHGKVKITGWINRSKEYRNASKDMSDQTETGKKNRKYAFEQSKMCGIRSKADQMVLAAKKYKEGKTDINEIYALNNNIHTDLAYLQYGSNEDYPKRYRDRKNKVIKYDN